MSSGVPRRSIRARSSAKVALVAAASPPAAARAARAAGLESLDGFASDPDPEGTTSSSISSSSSAPPMARRTAFRAAAARAAAAIRSEGRTPPQPAPGSAGSAASGTGTADPASGFTTNRDERGRGAGTETDAAGKRVVVVEEEEARSRPRPAVAVGAEIGDGAATRPVVDFLRTSGPFSRESTAWRDGMGVRGRKMRKGGRGGRALSTPSAFVPRLSCRSSRCQEDAWKTMKLTSRCRLDRVEKAKSGRRPPRGSLSPKNHSRRTLALRGRRSSQRM